VPSDFLASDAFETNANFSKIPPCVPVQRPSSSITIICNSSFDPPTLAAYVEVPGAESNSPLYAHAANVAESATETKIEFPSAPGYFAANSPTTPAPPA